MGEYIRRVLASKRFTLFDPRIHRNEEEMAKKARKTTTKRNHQRRAMPSTTF